MTATVSVLLPVYNRAASVGPALDSVLGQTVPPDEVIVIDDGSTDDLDAALRPYRDRIVLLRQDNGGVASARNRGASVATGAWLAFQDSDDLWCPDHLETVHRDLAGGGDVVCHLGDVAYKGGGYDLQLLADIKGRRFPDTAASRVDRPLPLVISGMTLQAAAIRRDTFLDLGGFAEDMRMLSDTEFFCRLALTGPFLVTGQKKADIIRLASDRGSITAMGAADRVFQRDMALRVLRDLPRARLTAAEADLLARQESGARFRLAEALHAARKPGWRRQVRMSAALHPSRLTGYAKAAAALVAGRAGFAAVLNRNQPLDRG